MEWLSDPQILLSLLTLTVLEIVLGVDNLVFLTILSDRLPPHQRPLARKLGLAFALLTRLGLLASLAWLVGLTDPVFTVFDHAMSWRDIILFAGGLFLLAKSTHEIHGSLEGDEEQPQTAGQAGKMSSAFMMTIVQIGILDIVFSLDSVITAVGMAQELWVMVTAVIIAVLVMLLAAEPLARFVSAHPTVKMLALAFLLLIGMALVADSLGVHIPKGYLYFAMGFSVMVEVLNLVARKKRSAPVKLRSDL